MAKRILIGVAAVVVVVVGVGVAGAAFIYFSGGSGEPSAPVTAPPVEASQGNETPTATITEGTGAESDEEVPQSEVVRYQIVQEQSTVSFRVDEILNGNPNTVVGTTDQVAAEILVDLSEPSSAQIGTVVVNARTFATDSSFRDRAIRGRILDSADDEFEFITFAPTFIDDIPERVVAGQPVAFNVTGDLTIRTITQQVTFAVTLSEVSRERIVGSASTLVTRADFELSIPSVRQVAGVEEEVELLLDFVAEPFAS